ncbi:hypothetical protein TCAL_17190 [Tigriopus californicus]|uniref:Vinculin n=1 Tax=Tigriopus californicus TaxID=6832 RepID=A0A553N6I8_TIGCA|nr:uncharacterized protein LOC131885047 [Tigriopus californicus]TRY61052.1 hypothetical protein TCAL_17190 [Tigriopus californicus]
MDNQAQATPQHPQPPLYAPPDLQTAMTGMVEGDIEVGVKSVDVIAAIKADPYGDRRQERAKQAAACARSAANAARHVATSSPTPGALRAARLAESLASTAETLAATL